MSTNGRWAEEEKGRSRGRFSLFFFSQRQRERRQTEGDEPLRPLPGRFFGWEGACIGSQAAAFPTIPAGADPACQSPARAIFGMWNLGQRGGGREGVAVALAAGKLAGSEEVGGHSTSCSWPLPRGPPLPGSHGLNTLPPPTYIYLPTCICAHVKVTKSFHAPQHGGGAQTAHSLETDAKERGQPSDHVASEGETVAEWEVPVCLCVSIWREVIMGRTVQVLH